MVEKILLLDKLSRVELIKLLDIDSLSLEKLVDLKIVVDKELSIKHKEIDKIEFKDEYKGFYNMKLSCDYDKLDNFSLVDLVELIKIKEMDFCELLYLDIIIDNALDELLKLNGKLSLECMNNSFSLYDCSFCNFGKINLIANDDLMYGVDENYNFYVGKINKNRRCILFNVMRKGLPYDLCRDILVFNGTIDNNNRIKGVWNVGIGEINEGVKIINNMSAGCYIDLCDEATDIRDLDIAYMACSEGKGSLSELLKSINNDKKKLMRG